MGETDTDLCTITPNFSMLLTLGVVFENPEKVDPSTWADQELTHLGLRQIVIRYLPIYIAKFQTLRRSHSSFKSLPRRKASKTWPVGVYDLLSQRLCLRINSRTLNPVRFVGILKFKTTETEENLQTLTSRKHNRKNSQKYSKLCTFILQGSSNYSWNFAYPIRDIRYYSNKEICLSHNHWGEKRKRSQGRSSKFFIPLMILAWIAAGSEDSNF